MKNIIKKPFAYSYSNFALFIIAINLLVFLLTSFNRNYMAYLAMRPINIINFQAYWQFVTYMFTHANLSHILFNMLGLFFFGFSIERRMGSREFLLFYFFCGIGAGIFSFFFYVTTGNVGVFLLGASGAVYAVLLAYAVFFPNAIIYIMGIIPLKSTWVVIIYTAIEIFSQLGNRYSSVAHFTHLAGFAFAYLYIWVRLGINPADIFFRRR
ncbi:MAG: rhomboid family intramembrane serine protease [Spirochaetaceae bacterium]|nr:rhomboid family intramembrane serine protease [Spirochaetaceae bacterium]